MMFYINSSIRKVKMHCAILPYENLTIQRQFELVNSIRDLEFVSGGLIGTNWLSTCRGLILNAISSSTMDKFTMYIHVTNPEHDEWRGMSRSHVGLMYTKVTWPNCEHMTLFNHVRQFNDLGICQLYYVGPKQMKHIRSLFIHSG